MEGDFYYVTNNNDYENKYQIDVWEEINDFPPCYKTVSAKQLKRILEELLEVKGYELNDLIEEFKKTPFTDSMTIHQWEVCDLEDYLK